MSETRLRRLAGPAGTVAAILTALSALVFSIRGTEGKGSEVQVERVAKLEKETELFKDWLVRIEKKLDRVIERKESR
jgi:hypothetical protein